MITVGERLPLATFKRLTPGGLMDVDSQALFAGRRVALFGVPGAYTPVCSCEHLPGMTAEAESLKASGIDEVACVSINDPFVLDAWSKSSEADGKVTMLADADGAFTRALGLTVDLPDFGLGERSQRYAMLVEDGVVHALEVERSVLDVKGSSARSMVTRAQSLAAA